MAWTGLPQIEDRSFFDLLGKVLEKPAIDASTQLPRLNVVLCNGNLKQTVHFLGHHSTVVLQVGDVVALSGIRLHTWRQERTLETSFLTVVEVNPLPRGDLFDVLDKDDSTHRRKALRITTPNILRVSDVQHMMQTLLNDAPTNEQREFTITGRLPLLVDDFFDNDPPIKGDGPTSKMCWQTHLEDNTGRLPVRLWDKACFEVFHVTAPKLQSMWEDGLEHEDKRAGILETLNGDLQHDVRLVCAGKIWTFGAQNDKHEMQVNANMLEVVVE